MGYSFVNILGGLLIVTSTMVVVSKTIPSRHQAGTRSSRLVLVGRARSPSVPHHRCAASCLCGLRSAFITKVDPRPVTFSTAPTRRWVRLPSDASLDLRPSSPPGPSASSPVWRWPICFAVVTQPEPAHRRGRHAGPRHQLRSLLRRPHLHHLAAQHHQADLRVLPYGERQPRDARSARAHGPRDHRDRHRHRRHLRRHHHVRRRACAFGTTPSRSTPRDLTELRG